ncbi:MAG: sigma factor [Polyangia bacterium]
MNVEPSAEQVIAALLEHRGEFAGFLRSRLGGDHALVDDLLQEGLARALEHARELERPEALVPWFYGILRNAVVDHHRRAASRARALVALAAELDHVAAPLVDERSVPCACVGGIAKTLTPDHADAIEQVDVLGLAVKDYASERGLTASHAGVRLHRARRTLRAGVVARCGACAARGCVDCTCVT